MRIVIHTHRLGTGRPHYVLVVNNCRHKTNITLLAFVNHKHMMWSTCGYLPLDLIRMEWVGRKDQFITVATWSISTKTLKFHPQIFPVFGWFQWWKSIFHHNKGTWMVKNLKFNAPSRSVLFQIKLSYWW